MDEFEKITINTYDKIVADYIKNTDELHPFEVSKKFLSYLGKNKLVLDLGCGPGRDAKIFALKGLKVIGIDLSTKMIKAAKNRVKNAEFRVMDIRSLEFEDNYFDGVWAQASFLHIPKKDILKGLSEVYRVIKPKGIFYISVKQGQGEVLKPDKRYDNKKKFWSFFKKKEIENMLVKAGFDIIESYVNKEKHMYATNPWIRVFCRK